MKSRWLSGPYVIWMILFTLIPLGVVFYFAFTDLNGGFTLANLAGMGAYLPIFLRSVGLSLISALICLVIGYPVAYCIAQALISAVPEATTAPRKDRIILEGDIPNPVDPPKGCRFCQRCRKAQPRCFEEEPPLVPVGPDHLVRCHFVKEVADQ